MAYLGDMLVTVGHFPFYIPSNMQPDVRSTDPSCIKGGSPIAFDPKTPLGKGLSRSNST